MASYLNTNYLKTQTTEYNIKSPFRNVVKSTLAIERLKPATELKSVSRGNEFHAFTTRSLKKT